MTIKREGVDEDGENELGDGEKGNSDSHSLASPTLKKEKDIKREKDIKKETIKTEHRDPAHRTKDIKVAESEIVRDLKAQLKYVYDKCSLLFIIYFLNLIGRCNFRKAVNEMKEMKLLLDMYKTLSKEQRDKAQLMAAERKTRAELEEVRQQLKKIQVNMNKLLIL